MKTGLGLLTLCGLTASAAASPSLDALVTGQVRPLMARYDVPGVAVGILRPGESRILFFGEASRLSHHPVDARTLFEIGSLSKTFTVSLTSLAQRRGRLSWDDTVESHLPALRGSAFGRRRLDNLATHTAGELPLQIPESLTTEADLVAWLARWQAPAAEDSSRKYTNIGIGLLGSITAQALRQPFTQAMQEQLLQPLGLTSSFYRLPTAREGDYAQGYTRDGRPVRLNPGLLGDEAYGLKSSAADLLRWVAIQLHQVRLPAEWQTAVDATRTAYFRVGPFDQDLIWEQYALPVSEASLLAGNGEAIVLHSQPARRLQPPLAPQRDVYVNKTGSTNGFSAYIAFSPARQFGLVLLANKNLPMAARVGLAWRLFDQLARPSGPS